MTKTNPNSDDGDIVIDGVDDKYPFFNDVCLSFINNTPQLCDDIICSSGRQTKKTTAICRLAGILMMMASTLNKTAVVYLTRRYNADMFNLNEDLRNVLDTHFDLQNGRDYRYTARQNQPRLDFSNGFIRLLGFHKSRNDDVPFKGLPTPVVNGKQPDIALYIVDEANEISKAERQALMSTARGVKTRVFIFSCNPDFDYQHLIEYCATYFPHDRETLETQGFQRSPIIDIGGRRTIFNYNTYRVNEWLNEDDLKVYDWYRATDPPKYDSWGLGLPVSIELAPFARYLSLISPNLTFNPIRFRSGMDLGQSDISTGHETAIEFVGFDVLHQDKPLAEFSHDPIKDGHKNPIELANEIVFWFRQLATRFPGILLGHKVNVDYGSGGGFDIAILNEVARTHGVDHWLKFIRVDKSAGEMFRTESRISYCIDKMTRGQMFVDPKISPRLWYSLRNLRRIKKQDEDKNVKFELLDKAKDPWDAYMYAVMEDMSQAVKKQERSMIPRRKQQTVKNSLILGADSKQW